MEQILSNQQLRQQNLQLHKQYDNNQCNLFFYNYYSQNIFP